MKVMSDVTTGGYAARCICGCGKAVVSVVGKQQRTFYSDACRKRWKRATSGQVTPDKSGGAITTQDTRSSSTGDPRDTESGGNGKDPSDPLPGMGGMTVGDMALPTDVMVESCGDPPGDRVFVEGEPGYRQTSRCYRDSGIPLPGDPGYEGVCVQLQGGTVQTDGKWVLDPDRKRLTRAEMQKRHAHV